MDLNVQRAKVLAKLPDFDSRGFGLGAVPLAYTLFDQQIAFLSEIQKQLKAGLPSAFSLSNFIDDVYNQGSLPSCVAHSTAAMQSIFERIEHGAWFTLNAEECYRANGGDGHNGVNSRVVLNWEETSGMQDIASSVRYKIGSFAVADPKTSDGITLIKAAIATRRPCVLALLLPQDFWIGDSTGEVVTNGYHQICVTGYTSERFEFVNSWGRSFGNNSERNNGLGTIPWAFIGGTEVPGRVFQVLLMISELEPMVQYGLLAQMKQMRVMVFIDGTEMTGMDILVLL
ncbi:MAG: hypothetical protein HZC48_02010 [Nitrospirae bacterium]|nr:hypothetical protein [Nitrospirota bacterium]